MNFHEWIRDRATDTVTKRWVNTARPPDFEDSMSLRCDLERQGWTFEWGTIVEKELVSVGWRRRAVDLRGGPFVSVSAERGPVS